MAINTSPEAIFTLPPIALPYRSRATQHTPCDSLSTSHDLTCGHRISTPTPSRCGTACANPPQYPLMHTLEPFICRTCVSSTTALRLGLPPPLDLSDNFGAGTIETSLALGMLDFFIEDEVKKLKDAGYRDAEPIAKTDTLGRVVDGTGPKVLKGEEAVMATTENFFCGTDPEAEEQKIEALECVFCELDLGGAIDAMEGCCTHESGDDEGDEMVRARFEEMELREWDTWVGRVKSMFM